MAETPLGDLELHYTTMMPGVILQEGKCGTGAPACATTAEGGRATLRYLYDAHQLAQQFPNLDRQDGSAYFDTITISLLLSGTEPGGRRRHLARQIVLQGEELQMPDQKPQPIPPRRRPVRK